MRKSCLSVRPSIRQHISSPKHLNGFKFYSVFLFYTKIASTNLILNHFDPLLGAGIAH